MAFDGTANTVATLNGHFKEAYADKIQDLRPEGVQLLNAIDFISADRKLGNLYHQPVILTHENGFTYGGSAGEAFALQGASASASRDAQVQGTELVLRSFLSIAAASRSQNSKTSFISETKLLVENMLKSMARRLEITMFYGQSGVGVVESVTGLVVKIYDREWASGIWSAMEGATIQIYDPTLVTLRVTTTITSVNLDTHELTLAAVTGVVADDVIYFNTALGNEFAGFHRIMTNTGTLFNINAATYNLWKSNIVNVGASVGAPAALSFAKIEEGVARAMSKGLVSETVSVFVSPLSWKNLLTEQAAKRMYDDSYKSDRVENGSQSIRFHGLNGVIEIMASIYVKEGYAYIIPLKDCMRIGSTDITFEQPGFEGKFLRLLENNNGYEMRSYTDQALFCSYPGKLVLLRYIAS